MVQQQWVSIILISGVLIIPAMLLDVSVTGIALSVLAVASWLVISLTGKGNVNQDKPPVAHTHADAQKELQNLIHQVAETSCLHPAAVRRLACCYCYANITVRIWIK